MPRVGVIKPSTRPGRAEELVMMLPKEIELEHAGCRIANGTRQELERFAAERLAADGEAVEVEQAEFAQVQHHLGHAAGEEDGLLYLAMRYVDGRDLSSLIASLGRLDAPGQLDVAPNRYPANGSRLQQRGVGPPPRRGHDQPDTVDQVEVAAGRTERHLRPEDLQDLRVLPLQLTLSLVHGDDAGEIGRAHV